MNLKGILTGLVIGLSLGGIGIGIYISFDDSNDQTTFEPFTTESVTTKPFSTDSAPTNISTTNLITTTPFTTLEPTTNQVKTQSLFYTVGYHGGSIYHYNIDEFGSPLKKAVHKIPYDADFARIVYNYELSSLEIVGDYWASYTAEVNTYHYRMSEVGFFSQVYELFSPLQYGSLVYVETVGTLCIGGYNNTGVYSTQIITQNRAWPKIFYYDHLLASYDSDAGYLWLGVTHIIVCAKLKESSKPVYLIRIQ